MSRQRFVQLLIAAVIAISLRFLNARRNQSADTAGLPVFPGLAADLGSVTAVSLRKGGATPTVTLHKSGDVWTVAERADYPADLGKLRKLLLSLATRRSSRKRPPIRSASPVSASTSPPPTPAASRSP
jgi:hypothetical protein